MTLHKFSGPVFAIAIITLFCAGLLLLPALSSAATLSGDSRTYMQSRETPDSTKLLGVYEYLDLAVQDLGSETISFHTGGWLRSDLKGEEFGRKTNDDLQYSYLSFKKRTDNTVINLGRVMVFEGVAAERVDGIFARTDLLYNFAVSAFGGAPVETGVDAAGRIYGARLAHQVPGLYRVGLSYLKEEKNSAGFREEEGIDLWFHPLSKVDLSGRSNYNVLTRGWMDSTYNLVLGPFAKVRLTTEASWINYADYFRGATTTAFVFSPDVLDMKEQVRRVGEEVSYALTDTVNISVDYRSYDYQVAGSARSYGGAARYAAPASGGSGLSYRRMDGETDRLKYTEYRLYGFKKINKLDLALDLLDVNYDAAVNGVTNAWSASLAAHYDVTQRLKLGADVEYSKNPDFDRDVRAFLKAIYRFDLGARKEGV